MDPKHSVSTTAFTKLGDDELSAVSGASGHGHGAFPGFGPISVNASPVTVVQTGVNVGVQIAIGNVGPVNQTLDQAAVNVATVVA